MAPSKDDRVSLSAERMRELRVKCAELLRRAVLTLDALPDKDKEYLRRNLRSSLPPVVRDWLGYQINEFDAAPSGRERLRITPKDVTNCLEVMSWLSWLQQEHDGKRDVAIIIARAKQVPWWVLKQRFGKSDDTLRRWHSGAVAAITEKFWHRIDTL